MSCHPFRPADAYALTDLKGGQAIGPRLTAKRSQKATTIKTEISDVADAAFISVERVPIPPLDGLCTEDATVGQVLLGSDAHSGRLKLAFSHTEGEAVVPCVRDFGMGKQATFITITAPVPATEVCNADDISLEKTVSRRTHRYLGDRLDGLADEAGKTGMDKVAFGQAVTNPFCAITADFGQRVITRPTVPTRCKVVSNVRVAGFL